MNTSSVQHSQTIIVQRDRVINIFQPPEIIILEDGGC